MSLDVYLTRRRPVNGPATPVERIYVRRDGATVEITRAEWDEQHAGRAPAVVVAPMDACEVFTANITHNLGRMADEVGLYDPMWAPDDGGITTAAELIGPLQEGLRRLVAERDRLLEFNPANGWGDYDLLVRFTENYLVACLKWPDAEVSVWR